MSSRMRLSTGVRLTVLLTALLLAGGSLGLRVPVAHAQGEPSNGGPSSVNVEIILDSSGSMGQTIGGESKMSIAKRVLHEVVAAIPDREGINVGFRIYGHRGDNTAAGRAESCRSSDLLVPIEGVNKALIASEIDASQPTGWTPLAYSLGLAGRDFPPATDGVANAVVLVTDGLETCGGDPCAVSAALHGSDTAITTHVIGFGLQSGERQTLQCIADNGGGLLLGARTADELSKALFTILGELQVVSSTGTLVLESIDGLWPDATAVCAGPVDDSAPLSGETTVRFDHSNQAQVPVGTCQVSWTEATGDVSRVSVDIAADQLTTIGGSVLAFPQGAGNRYRVTGSAGIRVWEAPFEWGDRVWVVPGRYRVDLVDHGGSPVLLAAEVTTTAATILSIHVATEP